MNHPCSSLSLKNKWTLALAVGATLFASPAQSKDVLSETEAEFQERMQWFTDAQFGLFIHYGVYSNLGGEWKGESVPRYAEWIQRWGQIPSEEYYPLAADFRPDELDADLWVRTAKEAGMKYMVITTKHHEGFCLWDSAVTEYDLGEATDFDRDILGELKAACEKYGLKFGTYYSIIDWHHPSQRVELATNQPPMYDKDGYVTYMKAQLKELIDRYDPAIMWFDGDWVKWWTMEDGLDLYRYLRELSPDMVINNRVAKRAQFKKDFGTPENSTPGGALDHVWEACWTVNHSWGYKKSDTTWKSIDVLIQKQIDINAKGGNLLLNVGPYADGAWPEASTELLEQMGEWNRKHREAVYDSEFVMVPEQSFGTMAQKKGSTEKKGELFAYVFDWPEDGKLKIQNLSFGKVKATTYQGRGLAAKAGGNDLEIDLSKAKPESSATVIRLKYSGGMKAHEQVIDLGLKGDELILEAGNAEVTGRKLVLVNKKYVSGWLDAEDRVSWTLNVPAPGKYLVKALYANDVDGSPVSVTVGDQTLSGKIEASGSKNQYQLTELGHMELNQVGATNCSISFDRPSGKRILRFKTLIFVPVEE
ncbi:alpha-L-fucosidase [Pelagicoccus sp. SDUM812005]|uniref:alpha-L-fucosidase n=1 Tax=Pelagicoccus sp. SDUM812005 TaxID=3041257 RepID=UPI00280D84FA|nr:alpha-L-fucosidase [Pelagicoccus sp. SDUM812005]MDQ8179571.1 alpha-L-fucosidase [Pelagicoccus sp. SDUM812005]